MKNEIQELLKETIRAIEGTTSLFYQQDQQKGYADLNKTLGVIIETFDKISKYKKQNPLLQIDENKLNDILINATVAIEEKDTVLLSDILQYDLIDELNDIKDNISNIED